MAIPLSDLLIIAIGTIASVTSFLLAIFYPKWRKESPGSRLKKFEKVSVTIHGTTINAKAPPKDVKKILSILRRYQSSTIMERSYKQ